MKLKFDWVEVISLLGAVCYLTVSLYDIIQTMRNA